MADIAWNKQPLEIWIDIYIYMIERTQFDNFPVTVLF